MWVLWILFTVLFYARLIRWYDANGYYDDPSSDMEPPEFRRETTSVHRNPASAPVTACQLNGGKGIARPRSLVSSPQTNTMNTYSGLHGFGRI